jgi:hypothetical protein
MAPIITHAINAQIERRFRADSKWTARANGMIGVWL